MSIWIVAVIVLAVLFLGWLLSRFAPNPNGQGAFASARGVPDSSYSLDELLSVLRNRKVTLLAMRGECSAARDIVLEFVCWAGGMVVDLTLGEIALWIHVQDGMHKISISVHDRRDMPKWDDGFYYDDDPGASPQQALARYATVRLCEYARHLSNTITPGQGESAEDSSGRYERISADQSYASIPTLRRELPAQVGLLNSRSITVCGYPDFAPWLVSAADHPIRPGATQSQCNIGTSRIVPCPHRRPRGSSRHRRFPDVRSSQGAAASPWLSSSDDEISHLTEPIVV